MKKLIFKEENPTITPDELHSTSYIGLEKSNGYRSFLLTHARVMHVSSELMLINEQSLGADRVENITAFFKDADYTLYVFESSYDLMKWVYYMDESVE